jgi:hypothetical protein
MKVTPIVVRTAPEAIGDARGIKCNVTHFALDIVDVADLPQHQINERKQHTDGLNASIQVFA